MDSGILSMLIASVTLLLALHIYSRIQRARSESVPQRALDQLAADNRRIQRELTGLTEEVREMRKLLVEAG